MGTAQYAMDRQQNQVYISKIPIPFVLLMCCVATPVATGKVKITLYVKC